VKCSNARCREDVRNDPHGCRPPDCAGRPGRTRS
jgi:hypothetical protein